MSTGKDERLRLLDVAFRLCGRQIWLQTRLNSGFGDRKIPARLQVRILSEEPTPNSLPGRNPLAAWVFCCPVRRATSSLNCVKIWYRLQLSTGHLTGSDSCYLLVICLSSHCLVSVCLGVSCPPVTLFSVWSHHYLECGCRCDGRDRAGVPAACPSGENCVCRSRACRLLKSSR